jgi:hypothetical protein
MNERTDVITAARVDATLILLPLIGWQEAACTLSINHVPIDVAARVLANPDARRRVEVHDFSSGSKKNLRQT